MTTIYSELLAAAGTAFLPQAEGEPDAHYIRRLVLAVSKASDSDWERLSKEAQDWYNAQAKRVKAHQNPEECPGFDGAFAQWEHEHKDDQVAFVDASVDQLASAGFDKGILEELEAQRKRVAHLAGLDNLPASTDAIIDAVGDAIVDVGWPVKITPDDAPAQADAAIGTVPLGDQDSPHALSPKHTATDAVRALVMQHQDWNQSQIAAELEAHGQPVSLGTIATVRSMTLATIAVAKGLGKWVEG